MIEVFCGDEVHPSQLVSIEEFAQTHPADNRLIQKFHEVLTPDFYENLTHNREEASKRVAGTKRLADRVFVHEELPDWVIKGGQQRRNALVFSTEGPAGSNRFSSLHRVIMAERIQEVINRRRLDLLSIPKKILAPFPAELQPVDATLNQRYCVLAEQLSLLGQDELISSLGKMEESKQRRIAQQIATVIQETGLCDIHYGNICMDAKERLWIVDTEPMGTMIESSEKEGVVVAVEHAARVGLARLAATFGDDLPVFKEVAEERLKRFDEPAEEVSDEVDHSSICTRLSRLFLSCVMERVVPLLFVVKAVACVVMKYFSASATVPHAPVIYPVCPRF